MNSKLYLCLFNSNMVTNKNTATLLIHCPDQKGIVSTVTEFISSNKGNIVSLDQHIDVEAEVFFMRVKWDLKDFSIPKNKIGEYFDTLIAEKYKMNWNLAFSNKPLRMAVFVSKMSHCLYDIMGRYDSGELDVEIPLIISNHEHLKHVAEKFKIPFYYLPITKDNKMEQEKIQLKLLQEHSIDFVVLARYMQILSSQVVDTFEHKVINIHHSFLPAFAGAKPYHSAYKRGVKLIGATGHYVTEELDAGPIISQDVVHVDHRNTIKDLVRKGRDLEKVVLSRAIYAHIHNKTLVYNNRTIVFD